MGESGFDGFLGEAGAGGMPGPGGDANSDSDTVPSPDVSGGIPNGQERPFDGDSIPSFDPSEGEFSGIPGGGNFEDMGGRSIGGFVGFLQGVKSFWIPILVVCLLLDSFCVFMLLRIRKREKAAAAHVLELTDQVAEERKETPCEND